MGAFVDTMIAFVLRVIVRYRRDVIAGNMAASLQPVTQIQVNRYVKKYYRFLARVIRQILFTPTARRLHRQMTWSSDAPLDTWLAEGKSVLVTFGHIGNWEWAGSFVGMQYPHQVCALYKKIKTQSIDRMMFQRRNTHVDHLIEIGNVGELLRLMKKKSVLVLMLSDQNPGSDQGLIWANFLGRETAFVNGPESLSLRYKLPVVYLDIQPDGKGAYHVHCTPLHDGQELLPAGAITQRFATALENNIRAYPVEWLWSHKRWKRSPPQPQPE